MDIVKMTEREVIEYTIARGFKGEEFETQAWKQRGCLRQDGTFKKLINKLETCFEIVEIEGKGKNKVYILSNPKDELTPLKDKRKGRTMPRKDENVTLTNYVHTMLIEIGSNKLNRTSYKKLGEQLFYGENHSRRLRGSVREIFKDFLLESKVREVWSYTEWYFEHRATKEIKLALEQLQKQSKIMLEKFYVGNYDKVEYNADGRETISSYFKKLDSDLVSKIEQVSSGIAAENGFDYSEYKAQSAMPYKSKKLMELQEEIKRYLKNNFGINYVYEAIEIMVLDTEPSETVQYREAQDTFLSKTLRLVKEKKDTAKYAESKRKSEKFHYLCTLLYVKALRIAVPEGVLEDELSKIPISLKEVVESYDQQKPLGFIHSKS